MPEHQPQRHRELFQPLHSPLRGQILVHRYKYQYTDVERDAQCPKFFQLLDECAGANLTTKLQDTKNCLRTKRLPHDIMEKIMAFIAEIKGA